MTGVSARGESASAATAARREDIIDAAASLMAERGSKGTSIAAVAERAGMTDAGVLYHFKTKKALLLAVLARSDRAAEDVLVDPTRTPLEHLRATREWGAHMERFPEIQSLLIMLTAEHLHESGQARTYLRKRYRNLLRRYTGYFADAAAAGDLRADLDPSFEASALLAHLDGIRFQWFLGDGTISMDKSVRMLVDTTLARLAPEPAR